MKDLGDPFGPGYDPFGTKGPNWLPIPGYEEYYAVSSDGRVLSRRRNRELALVPDTPGYLTVKLSLGGCEKRYAVHRLVCLAFNGEPFEGAQVAHLNGNRRDNRAENLVWATCTENNSHKVLHGTRQSGTKNGRAKFSDEVIARVHHLHRAGYSEVRIAEATGVSTSHVHRIIAGEARNEPATPSSCKHRIPIADAIEAFELLIAIEADIVLAADFAPTQTVQDFARFNRSLKRISRFLWERQHIELKPAQTIEARSDETACGLGRNGESVVGEADAPITCMDNDPIPTHTGEG